MSEHVPTDWQLGCLTPGLIICRRDGLQVKIDAIDDDLACFILHAVKDYQKTAAMRNSHAALDLHREAVDLFDEFLKSLPTGWLGKTTGNIGLLNDAFCKLREARAALAAAEGK